MGKGEGCCTNYPKRVFLILTNEFCERFSFYGMKAILVLFMTRALQFDDNTATSLYHGFNVLCYFTPILGAMVADGWLGKYRTILYVSMIYAAGNIVMTVTSIPFNGSYVVWAPFIGLILIGIGTGGIKPCVSAFGGDQFNTEQQRQKESFFSLFYMSINIGSLLSTIITPLIRSNVYCFDEPCYVMAFGLPAGLMIISIGVFAIGTPFYVKNPAGENIIGRMIGCTWTALVGKCRCGKPKEEKKDHWLEYASPKYDDRFISDLKDVYRVAWLFLPLPVFWALFDQQSSRWTLQAASMNGDFGAVVVPPDLIHMLNPLFVVTIVPLLESLIHPCLNKLKIPNRPLQRMSAGMLLAGTAFLLAGFLQIGIDNSGPAAIGASQTKVKIISTSACPVAVTGFSDNQLNVNLTMESDIRPWYTDSGNYSFDFTYYCGQTTYTINSEVEFVPGRFVEIIISEDNTTFTGIQEKVDMTPDGNSFLRIFNAGGTGINSVYLKPTKNQEHDPRNISNIPPFGYSAYENLIFADFEVYINIPPGNQNATSIGILQSRNGAVYTMTLVPTAQGSFEMQQFTDVYPPTINIFLQVPQYFIMTLGECLFSVTGLAFAYTQAPPSMKSILTAIWLLTVAIGNVVVIIVAEVGSFMSQMAEFFLFSGLMYVTTIIFIIMSLFYKYVSPQVSPLETKDIETSSVSSSSISHHKEKTSINGKVPDADEELPRKRSTASTASSRSNDKIELEKF